MGLSDRTLTCRDCGMEFLFTIGEQQFFQSKGPEHEPGRCPACRALNKRPRNEGPDQTVREYHETVCAECGKPARVPFLPRNDRPVYCSSCFDRVRTATA